MNNYQIYVNNKATDFFYKAESKEEAIIEFVSDFINVFIDEFGTFPDMVYFDWIEALKIYPIE